MPTTVFEMEAIGKTVSGVTGWGLSMFVRPKPLSWEAPFFDKPNATPVMRYSAILASIRSLISSKRGSDWDGLPPADNELARIDPSLELPAPQRGQAGEAEKVSSFHRALLEHWNEYDPSVGGSWGECMGNAEPRQGDLMDTG